MLKHSVYPVDRAIIDIKGIKEMNELFHPYYYLIAGYCLIICHASGK